MAKKKPTSLTAVARRNQQSVLSDHQVAWWYWRRYYLEAKRLQLQERMQDTPGGATLAVDQTA